MNHYYQILGLKPGASKADIKRAYRKLALKYHPDVNKANGAREQFLRISEAYNYLNNPPRHKEADTVKRKRADDERVKRAKAAATREARQRYAAFKRKQEAEQGRAYSQALATLIGLVLLAGAFYFGKKYINDWYVNQDRQETIAKVLYYKTRHFWISYTVEGKEYIQRISGNRSKYLLLTPNGMPVGDDLEFTLYYRKGNPDWYYVDYESFTPKTLDVYLTGVRKQIAVQYGISFEDARTECLALFVFDVFGVSGLADMIFWQESMLENVDNNSFTYGLLIEDELFLNHEKDCLLNNMRKGNVPIESLPLRPY